MDRGSLYFYTIWTNLPLFLIIYYLLIGILNVKKRNYFYAGAIGLLAYFLYMVTIFLYLNDEKLIYLLYIIKIVEPLYIIYLTVSFKSKNLNRIKEAFTIILILLFLGVWKYIT